jgi:hypothetical protein
MIALNLWADAAPLQEVYVDEAVEFKTGAEFHCP